MAKKPPAHEYIVESIRKAVDSIERHMDPSVDNNTEVWVLKANFLAGKLSAQIEMLTGFFIPEKHCGEVVDALREIKEGTSFKGIGEYISDEVLQAILSPPEEKAEEAVSKRCSICGSFLAPDEGVGSKHGLICETGCLQ